MLGGIAVLSILCGAGMLLLYVKAGQSVDDATQRRSPLPTNQASNGSLPGGPGSTGGPAPTGVPCAFRSATRGGGAARLVSTPAPIATLTGKVDATLETSLGTLRLRLDADRAPCTVHSFVHLVREDYYTDTPCHRLTTEGLWVLQCGDPTGTGTGSPGYQYDDENLPTAAPPYPRGTLAMANFGPGSNGAQFFIVYRDSDIPADYTVVGTITAGMDLLDRIAAAGTTDGTSDGRPKLDVRIDEIRVP